MTAEGKKMDIIGDIYDDVFKCNISSKVQPGYSKCPQKNMYFPIK